MRWAEILRELRSHPHLNPKRPVLDELSKYRKSDSVYISFQQINKLGINPRSSYETPIGIYAYPLKQVWNRYIAPALKGSGSILKGGGITHRDMNMANLLPFAGDSAHVYVFECPPQAGLVTDFSRYTEEDLARDCGKLSDWYEAKIGKKAGDFLTARLPLEATKRAKSKTPFGRFWYVTYVLASHVAHKMNKRDAEQGLPTDRTGTGMALRAPVLWNQMMREIGYVGFVDKRGQGIIHGNEPQQAVFLRRDALRVIAVLDNKLYNSKRPAYSIAHAAAERWLRGVDAAVLDTVREQMPSELQNAGVMRETELRSALLRGLRDMAAREAEAAVVRHAGEPSEVTTMDAVAKAFAEWYDNNLRLLSDYLQAVWARKAQDDAQKLLRSVRHRMTQDIDAVTPVQIALRAFMRDHDNGAGVEDFIFAERVARMIPIWTDSFNDLMMSRLAEPDPEQFRADYRRVLRGSGILDRIWDETAQRIGKPGFPRHGG